jgi:hypothetical protein
MKNIVYTDSARQKLVELHEDLDLQITQYLREAKYSFGDEFIEVTASDIEEVRWRIRIIKPNKQAYNRVLLVNLSIMIGITILLIGLFYPYFEDFINNSSPAQLQFTLFGLLLTVFGLLYLFLMRVKRNKEKELLKRSFEDKTHVE